MTTTTATSSACHKRLKDINSDYLRQDESYSAVETHQFPENEEPKIVGYGIRSSDPALFDDRSLQSQRNENTTNIVATEERKYTLNFEDAPDHLKFNPYIRRGYRTFLSTKLCLQSVFWWTNETINIWSHLFGCLFFLSLTILDFMFLKDQAGVSDQILVVCLLICFCLCMLLSSVYHIFSCRSEEHYDFFLSVDFLGIALSLVAIYISAMYYAFWCFRTLQIVYSVIALIMFALAVLLQLPKLKVSINIKIVVLLAWALYGVIPLFHWSVVMGGLENALVQLIVPRVVMMYGLCGIAYCFYAAKIPERWLAGRVDFFGHSHNWWHLFILGAFYHWHNTGLVYAEYRLNHGCSAVSILR